MSAPEPLPDIFEGEPRAMIQRTGDRERGFMAWEAWVEHGVMKYAQEWGTYAWTKKGAIRKARALMKRYRRHQAGPPIQIDVEPEGPQPRLPDPFRGPR